MKAGKSRVAREYREIDTHEGTIVLYDDFTWKWKNEK